MELERLIQIGKVSNIQNNKVRVIFQDTGIISDWLFVAKQAADWTPDINDIVLVIYLPSDDSDGFVIGRL